MFRRRRDRELERDDVNLILTVLMRIEARLDRIERRLEIEDGEGQEDA